MSKRYFEAVSSATEEAGSSDIKSARTADAATSTLFVSRLPFSATSQDLSTLFSDIGPLRKCFVVTDINTKRSKGVGYVQFAVRQDAQTALDKLNGSHWKGADASGKKEIRVEWAQGRGTKKERMESRAKAQASVSKEDTIAPAYEHAAQPPAKRPRRSNPYAEEGSSSQLPSVDAASPNKAQRTVRESNKDSDATRTIVLKGLSACKPAADERSLYKRVRKLGDNIVDSVTYPVPSEAGESDTDTAHVIFRTPNHALLSIPKLHNRIFKGALLRAILKRQHDGMHRLESSITNASTRARREEVIAQIEEYSALPDLLASATGKKGGGGGQRPVLMMDAQKVDGRLALTRAGGGAFASGKLEKKSRLIVRNLPFDVTVDDLKAVFLPYGPIYKIDLPQVDAKKKGPISETDTAEPESEENEEGEKLSEEKSDDDADEDSDAEQSSSNEDQEEGDAAAETTEIVEIAAKSEEEEEESDEEDEDGSGSEGEDQEAEASSTSPTKQAQSAELGTGATRGRGFAFIWYVVQSDAASALAALNGAEIQHGALERTAYKATTQSRDRRKIKSLRDAVIAKAQPPRKIAVDWSLSKDEWEKKKEESDVETDGEAEGEEEDDDDSDLEPVSMDVDGEQELKGPSRPPQPEEGTTLFIRNLPFNVTEQELRDLFRAFGTLRYARITMEKNTNRPKGNGFVCFWDKADADKVLEQAQLVARDAGTGANAIMTSAGKANPFSMNNAAASSSSSHNVHYSSILTADVSAPLTASLSLHGRLLSVTPALKREDAQAKEATVQAARQKGDKRNTWLLREGVPFPDSALAKQLNTAETDKRLQSFTVRRKQLETNPALFVSKTRLSVRNLPLFVGDKILKRLALHAVRTFAKQVKEGTRQDLSREEQLDETISAALESRSEIKKKKFAERPTAVIQSKVVRQPDRLDPIFVGNGLGRSRGYGFLEMRSFKDALKVVRWANANKDVASLFVEWHVQEMETAIERLKKELRSDGSAADSSNKAKSDENNREGKEDKQSQLKRLTKRVEEVKAKGGKIEKSERGGLVMIEFSIENVTITRQRTARADAQRGKATRPFEQPEREEVVDDRRDRTREDRSGRGDKRPKRDNWNQKTSKGTKNTALLVSQKKADLKVKAAEKEARGKRGGAFSGGAGRGDAKRIIENKRKEKRFKKGKP